MKKLLFCGLAMAAASAGAVPVLVRGPQPVTEIEMGVRHRCVDGEFRDAVDDEFTLKVRTRASPGETTEFYLLKAGYRLVMDGDAAGAAIHLSDASTGNRLPFAILDPEGRCRYEYKGSSRIRLEPSVQAELEVKPRTGLLHPACYNNVTTGSYSLSLSHVLTLRLADQTVSLTSHGAASFRTREECLTFHEALK